MHMQNERCAIARHVTYTTSKSKVLIVPMIDMLALQSEAMAEIRIPPVLRSDTGGNRLLDVEAATVREALDALIERYPSLSGRIIEGDGVPAFLNVFVDGEDVRLADGLATPVGSTTKILLLPAVAGGC
jgi:molybdopterin converting factor small subunit